VGSSNKQGQWWELWCCQNWREALLARFFIGVCDGEDSMRSGGAILINNVLLPTLPRTANGKALRHRTLIQRTGVRPLTAQPIEANTG